VTSSRRAALLALTAVLAAGCGEASSSRSPGPPAGAPAAAERGTRGQARSRPDLVTPVQRTSRARFPAAGAKHDEVNASGATTPNPCRLVTRSEASAIVGGPIAGLRTAPQGPTCIYRPRRAKTLITLALQPMSLSAARRRGTKLTRVALRGHKAVCLNYGSLVTLVPLGGGKVLNVTGPCPIGARFASRALARLG
jgi:hypothetical protein